MEEACACGDSQVGTCQATCEEEMVVAFVHAWPCIAAAAACNGDTGEVGDWEGIGEVEDPPS